MGLVTVATRLVVAPADTGDGDGTRAVVVTAVLTVRL
jgi:hypothetical protein